MREIVAIQLSNTSRTLTRFQPSPTIAVAIAAMTSCVRCWRWIIWYACARALLAALPFQPSSNRCTARTWSPINSSSSIALR
jgi:hypothetical protein